MDTGTKILTPEESKKWQGRLKDKNLSAKPLSFERAQDANAPFQVSVTNGQDPGGKTLIIQLEKRPDIDPDRALVIAQHALVDVFGPGAGQEAECDYRNVNELKKQLGKEMVPENTDNLTIMFGPGVIAFTRRPNWVRDNMAAALRRWYDASGSW
jgi:hypothetical protein